MSSHRRWSRFAGAILFVVSGASGWLGGLAAYRTAHREMFGGRASLTDVQAIGVWIAVATAVTIPIVWFPIVGAVRRRFNRPAARGLAGLLVGLATGPVTAAAVALLWGGSSLGALSTPEFVLTVVWASVFGAFLTAGGAVFLDFGPSNKV